MDTIKQNLEILTTEVYSHCPIHQRGSKVIAFVSRKAENRHHYKNKSRGGHSDWLTQFTKMPWSRSKPVPDKEYSNEDRDGESNVGCDSADGEDRANSYCSAEDQQQEKAAYDCIEPHSVDWSISILINFLDPPRTRKAIISGISKSHTGGGHHASLAHEECAHDSDGKNSERNLLWHHLNEIRCPWLPERGIKNFGYIDDSISNNKLQSPSHKTSNPTSQDDSSWSCDVGVATLLREMERSIVSRHRPNDGDKRHQDRDSVWPISAILNGPDLLRRKEFRCCGSPGNRRWNHDDYHQQSYHIQCRSKRVELRNP
ncbi:hypothetical protein SS1G_11407 [Sclerotinia sclerotiorum 1980 UF-70]|uniref:Uncharacterized protein n=1 Tax=Sclerotinia sclerotiorum (strain ATCC 18683 / 1980 / Ss-1) TaxID=665079 RepID=A7F1D7_SCLS1|nr:hypothetical protein SS1G_11407 [Sclerotinia sclerotiorum 1980 UF-70]EDN95529.1 hypothetical protein SS1G_11407 [Sclerotinia sclerotiorum 1980 UF-70]